MKLNRTEQALVPGVVLLVAAMQFALTDLIELSQWKGGGFGMFSSVDTPGSRSIRCTASLEGGASALIVFEGLPDRIPLERLRYMPRRRDMASLAAMIFQSGVMELGDSRTRLTAGLDTSACEDPFPRMSIRSEPPFFVPVQAPDAPGEHHRVSSVQIEVLRVGWDAREKTAVFSTIAEASFDAQPNP